MKSLGQIAFNADDEAVTFDWNELLKVQKARYEKIAAAVAEVSPAIIMAAQKKSNRI